MKARKIAEEFEKIAPIEIGLQEDRDAKILGFRFGNPDIEVKTVGVAWHKAVLNSAVIQSVCWAPLC